MLKSHGLIRCVHCLPAPERQRPRHIMEGQRNLPRDRPEGSGYLVQRHGSASPMRNASAGRPRKPSRNKQGTFPCAPLLARMSGSVCRQREPSSHYPKKCPALCGLCAPGVGYCSLYRGFSSKMASLHAESFWRRLQSNLRCKRITQRQGARLRAEPGSGITFSSGRSRS